MNGSSGPQNQRCGTKPTAGVPRWCVCVHCVGMACVWHADVYGLGAWGKRERVGGEKSRTTDREGGEDQWGEQGKERERGLYVVIEMLKASRRQSVCSLSLYSPHTPLFLSLSRSSLWAWTADKSRSSLEDNNGHHSFAAVSVAYLPALVFVAWESVYVSARYTQPMTVRLYRCRSLVLSHTKPFCSFVFVI